MLARGVDVSLAPDLVATLGGTPAKGSQIVCSTAARAGHATALLFGERSAFTPSPALIRTGTLLVDPLIVIGPLTVPQSGLLDVPVYLPFTWPSNVDVVFQFVTSPPLFVDLSVSNRETILIKS